MSKRLEQIQARMRTEQAAKAAKSAKPAKIAKVKPAKLTAESVAPEREPIDFSHLDRTNIIDDVVNKMSKEELSDPANIVRLLNAFVLDELVRYRRCGFFEMLSSTTLDSIIDLQKTSNPKVARMLAHFIADNFESRLTYNDADGSSGRRLRAMEAAIARRLQ
jgi:hypothetical protein